MTVILGISFDYHDSAAALLIDGEIVAAAQEERFTRRKHDASFPINAIRCVLETAGIEPGAVSVVVFYEKPFTKFGRLLDTYHNFAPRGLGSFLKAIPLWLKDKLHTRQRIISQLKSLGISAELKFSDHHLSHAASAFFPSPFDRAAILTIDGVGEYVTTSIGLGEGNQIHSLQNIDFPDSLGLFYSAVTYYCGFRVNGGEYKLMGLAPYGNVERAEKLEQLLRTEVIQVFEDGSYKLNLQYFNYPVGLTMTRDRDWQRLTGIPRRQPDSEITAEHIDLALAAQRITEDVIMRLAGTAKRLTGAQDLVLAGGVALNCTANGKLQRSGLFRNVWIQPAAGDAGGALGAALAEWYIGMNRPKRVIKGQDSMKGAYLGPQFTRNNILSNLPSGIEYDEFSDEDLFDIVARELSHGAIIGWFQGRMEFGPRALGNRSILADPRRVEMQRLLNLEIKFRESFRPFAPAVLEEDAEKFFEISAVSPYMLLTVPVSHDIRCDVPPATDNYMQRLQQKRSELPAVTHVDDTARVQTVSSKSNPRFYRLLKSFKNLTDCGVLINTSFNVRGEPIVCSPADAFRCFMATGIDILVIDNFVFRKCDHGNL